MAELDYKQLRLLVLDVDGVMTDGRIILSASGEETKSFCVKDGSGMKFWKRLGGSLAIITGRESEIVNHRAGELGVDEVRQNRKDKLPALQDVFSATGIGPEATAVIGDDLADLPMMHVCAFSACPSDAVEEVRRQADFVCRAAGGRGVVREVVEHILKRAGSWPKVMERYRSGGEGNHG
jgi:3-deoxy-D-manno-octulosonate 8-phosphate phosphatase (KDO 8-P phosphatase)